MTTTYMLRSLRTSTFHLTLSLQLLHVDCDWDFLFNCIELIQCLLCVQLQLIFQDKRYSHQKLYIIYRNATIEKKEI